MSLLVLESPVKLLLTFIYLLDKYLLNLSLVDRVHCWAPWTMLDEIPAPQLCCSELPSDRTESSQLGTIWSLEPSRCHLLFEQPEISLFHPPPLFSFFFFCH